MPTTEDTFGGDEPHRSARPQRFCKVLLRAGVCLCLLRPVLAQTPDSQPDDSNKHWTATTDSKADYGNPTRTSESHTQNGNRTVDVRSIETRGSDGSFKPYQDIETETVRLNATTVETITRTFTRDDNGAKTLFQVTEEERKALPGGDSKVTRTTSNPDANGNLQAVQREIQETRKTGPDTEETKNTVMLPSIDGNLAPAMQTQEHQKHNGDTVEIQKTTMLPDGSGGWQVGEIRQSITKGEDQNRTTDERVSRPDSDGKLEEITHTVDMQSQDVSGEMHDSKETYSIDVSGVGRDSSLHLVQRVTTTQQSSSGIQQTSELVERPNSGDPDAGLRVTTVQTDTVRSGSTGSQASRTIQVRDANGSLGVVFVDMTKSSNVQAIKVQIAPSSPK